MNSNHSLQGEVAPRIALTGRLEPLDALRGVAALCVLLHHLVLTFVDERTSILPPRVTTAIRLLDLTPLHIVRAGHEAVILFFVLSGFVLSRSGVEMSRHGYFAYLAKRVLRIYPTYVLVIVAAFGAWALWGARPLPAHTAWMGRHWDVPLSARVVAEHFALVGSFQNYKFDTVTWSLVEEMRMSLVFPVVAMLVRRYRWASLLSVFVALSVLGGVGSFVAHRLGFEFDYFETLQYGFFFWLGATLQLHLGSVARVWSGLGRKARMGLGTLSLLVYTYGRALNHLPGFGFVKELPFGDWAVGLAASAVIVIALFEPAVSKILQFPAAKLVGRWSYGLYLVHAVVLMALAHAIGTSAGMGLVALLAPPIALGLAWALHEAVEVPSVHLGRAAYTRIIFESESPKAGASAS